MSKKILFCTFFILTFLIPSKQDPNAKTWERHNTTVYADSILAAIDRGDSIIIDSCRIVGRLVKEGTWDKLDTIKSFIDISFSTFSDSVSFKYCYFIKEVIFQADTFGGEANFWSATFDSSADFPSAKFSGDANFAHATFGEHAGFLDVTFDSSVCFENAKFRRYAQFSKSTFKSRASFESATFDTIAAFSRAKFREDASFKAVTFVKGADFFHVAIDDTADFSDAKFHKGVDFDSATFGGHAEFSGVEFDASVCFTKATFDSSASFDSATFGGDANFSKATFGEKVNLSFVKFKNIDILWKQLDGHLICDILTGYKLMKYLEEQRQLDDADGVYLFLKNQERMNKSRLRRYFEYWLIQQTCGYGVEPLLPLRAGLIVVALFAIPYYWIKIREPKWALGAGLKRIRIKACNAFYFSVNTFVSGAPIEWTPEDTRSSKKHYLFMILTTAERIFGWILLVLFVVTLTRKFIR
jgi:hypothetical protein